MHDNEFRALGAVFAQGRMTAIAFEGAYLNLWRRYRDLGVPTTKEVDRLFTDVDVFCCDPELRNAGDLDEEGLRAVVVRFLRGEAG
ncbi:colicin immunity domain-containing protein [Glycomyces rhizosphaerae]|uniref:Colicin immunity domain-containing protein n=1 Tax=Glycomyces rhizosphaerae TaxID=2054422 RepID=A0ABV7PS21_9ACTN